jgi:hypothetical protein
VAEEDGPAWPASTGGRTMSAVRSRTSRRAAVASGLAACLGSASAEAAPARPWGAGTLQPGAAVEFGYARDAVVLGFGAGLDYFVLPGFSLGLAVSDRILLYSRQLRARLPVIRDQAPTNLFRATARMRYVFFRSRGFSPFIVAGLGPTLLNNRNGTFVHWEAGPGAYVHIAGEVYLELGMTFTGLFPTERCNDAFTVRSMGTAVVPVLDDFCSFHWGPRLGLVAAFGLPRHRQRRAIARRME